MQAIKWLLITTTAALALFLIPAPRASAQVSFGINIGAPPLCPYGYFGYSPYNCAPYGYYGPEWFTGGVFIGAGPWFHGPRGFYGPIDRRFDPRFGYRGGFPAHGGYREPADHFRNFHASHLYNGRNNYRGAGHGHGRH